MVDDLGAPDNGNMGGDAKSIKWCIECRRLVDSASMRPLSRNGNRGICRLVCPDCYKRISQMRKASREAKTKALVK